MDNLIVTCGGKRYKNWHSFRLVRQINAICSGFSLSVSAKSGDFLREFNSENKVKIEYVHNNRKHLLITGYTDRPQMSLEENSISCAVTGRSLSSDLMDCDIEKTVQLNDYTVAGLLSHIIAPFGLEFISSDPAGKTIKLFTFQAGERIFDAINRLSRLANVIISTTPSGAITVVEPGSDNAGTLTQGKNIIAASYAPDWSLLHSLYTLKVSNANVNLWADGDGKITAKSENQNMGRFRPKFSIINQAASQEECQALANWESSKQMSRASQLMIRPDSFFNSSGHWDINQIISVDIPSFPFNKSLLCQSVTLDIQRDSVETSLVLVPPESFKFQPVIGRKED
jgi:prophage tail gpP-like protein